MPFVTDEGVLIPLPYGPNTDWLKNVLAEGSAVLVTDGRTYTVDQPEVMPIAEVKDMFPPKEQRAHRRFGVDHCLLVRRVEPGDGAGSTVDPAVRPRVEPG
ncbi:MAG: hypothetical protein ACT4PI_03395 [Actinomycetota bacterium]